MGPGTAGSSLLPFQLSAKEQRGHRLPFASNFRLLLRRNVWPCVPAKRGLQKLADLI